MNRTKKRLKKSKKSPPRSAFVLIEEKIEQDGDGELTRC